MSPENPDRPACADEVLSYFVRYPRAADTLDGIARWRLREEAIQQRIEEVQRALEWLTATGFLIEASPLGAAETIYSLNLERLRDAQQLLNLSEH